MVGAGHNGLAAGVLLARAGWKVLVLEAQPGPGGAIVTAEATLPGFRHDLHATNLSGFAGSAFMREFEGELRRHGLEFVRAQNAYSTLFPDGTFLGITRRVEENLATLRAFSPHDAEAWRELTERFERAAPHLVSPMRERMPSWGLVRALGAGMRAMGPSWPLALARLAVQSHGSFVRRWFRDERVRTLWAAWGMHLDFPPHVAGGALFGWIQAMVHQRGGVVFARGGAGAMTRALAGLFAESGGELRCAARVKAILARNGAAHGVELDDGTRLGARRAVIANVTPPVLAGLLAGEAAIGRRARRWRHGPGTMMIHLAMAEIPPWRDPRARGFAYLNLAPSLEALSDAHESPLAGRFAAHPLLVVAQPTLVDPSRAPAGRHVLSVQVRAVPAAIDWDREKEAYADRVLALLEGYAPGLRERVLGRAVLSPLDLERANPNLVGGDNLSGSHQLGQQYVLRPFLGWSRYRTPLERLFLCGAATWPGAGTGAGSGYLLGKSLAR